MAGEYDFEILQGETFSKQFVWKNSAGTAVNLSGYTARMQVRQSKPSDTVLLELTTQNGRITLGGAAGTIDLNLNATTTAAIDWRRGLYDLELVASNGVVKRLIEGQVTVSKEVTR